MRWLRTDRRVTERGVAVAVEAALVIPALVLFVGLVIVLARGMLVDQAVGAAASQAARAASLERSASDATSAAHAIAAASLADAGARCQSSSVDVDAAGLTAPLGTPARVEVVVTCTIDHEVGLPGFPATRTISASATSPVDTYRGR